MLLIAMSLCLFISCTDDKDYTDDALKAVHGAWVADGNVSVLEPDGKMHDYHNAQKCGYYFDSDGYVYIIIDGEITNSKIKYKFSRALGPEGQEVTTYIFEFEFLNGDVIEVTEMWLYIQEKYLSTISDVGRFEFDETITR
ncbi:MAG: hypothetical protein K2F90_05545 [Clostridiales bacterium]|nr:hypothetical protein [Clostridiales bacterium]